MLQIFPIILIFYPNILGQLLCYIYSLLQTSKLYNNLAFMWRFLEINSIDK